MIAKESPYEWPQKALPASEKIQQQGRDSTVVHMAHWLDSIRTRTPYWEDAAAGHHAAACAHMINLAAREHRMVEWDFAGDDIKA